MHIYLISFTNTFTSNDHAWSSMFVIIFNDITRELDAVDTIFGETKCVTMRMNVLLNRGNIIIFVVPTKIVYKMKSTYQYRFIIIVKCNSTKRVYAMKIDRFNLIIVISNCYLYKCLMIKLTVECLQNLRMSCKSDDGASSKKSRHSSYDIFKLLSLSMLENESIFQKGEKIQ